MPDVKDHLKSMVTSIIDDNLDAARSSFHDALKAKMQDRLNPAPEPTASVEDDSVELDDLEDDSTEE